MDPKLRKTVQMAMSGKRNTKTCTGLTLGLFESSFAGVVEMMRCGENENEDDFFQEA